MMNLRITCINLYYATFGSFHISIQPFIISYQGDGFWGRARAAMSMPKPKKLLHASYRAASISSPCKLSIQSTWGEFILSAFEFHTGWYSSYIVSRRPLICKASWDWNAWQNSAHFRKSFQREGYETAKELRSTTLPIAGTKARSKTCTNRLAGAGEAISTDDGETSAVKPAGSLWKLCGEQKPFQLNFNLQLLQMSERHPIFTVGSWNS